MSPDTMLAAGSLTQRMEGALRQRYTDEGTQLRLVQPVEEVVHQRLANGRHTQSQNSMYLE